MFSLTPFSFSQFCNALTNKEALGKIGKDKITGFQGVIVGKCEYLTGCDQLCLQPPAKDGDFKLSQWFDSSRVEIVGKGIETSAVVGVKKGGVQRDCPK